MSALHKWVCREECASQICGSTFSLEWDVVEVFSPAVFDCPSFSHTAVSSGAETRSCTRTSGTLGRDWVFSVRFFNFKAA